MPRIRPGMRMALAGFQPRQRLGQAHDHHQRRRSDAARVSDDHGLHAAKIKISTVAVGAHGPAGHKTLQDIATATGGKYYVAKNAKALPRIFQIEARRVARPLIKDLHDVPPRLEYPHEMLQGIREPLPPLRGFVMTTVKENPLVEVALLSPDPPRSRERDDPGQLDLRAGPHGGVHHRRRAPLGQRLDRLGELRQVLQPDDPLVDAADQRGGQVLGGHRRQGRQGAGGRHGPGQGGRVPELPEHVRRGRGSGPEGLRGARSTRRRRAATSASSRRTRRAATS